jgi:uncharacterized membrane protein
MKSKEFSARALHALAIGFAVQCAVLLVVAVPLAFSGWAVMAGWAALAVGFACVGAALDLNVPRKAGVITWGLAVGYLAHWIGTSAEPATRVLTSIHSVSIPQYFAIGVALAIVGHAIARVIRPRDPRAESLMNGWSLVAQTGAGVVWAGVSVLALPPLTATASILVYAWLCALVDRLRPDLRLAWNAAGAVALAMTKWAVVDVMRSRLAPDWSPTAYAVMWNPIMALGAVIALSLGLIWWLRQDVFMRHARDDSPSDTRNALTIIISLAIVCLGFGLSVEVDRAVRQLAERATTSPAMPWVQVELLSLSLLWCAVGAAWGGAIRLVRGRDGMRPAVIVWTIAAILLAVKWLIVDTIGFRLRDGAAAVTLGLNLQAATAIAIFSLTLLAWWQARRGQFGRTIVNVLGAAMVILPFVAVSMEIDRWSLRQTIAPSWMACQVGWSGWWSIYAIGLVVAGFATRVAPLRYVGLALFALTAVKVVLIDLSAASTGLRILSFLGLGILLLATSVLYGKVRGK